MVLIQQVFHHPAAVNALWRVGGGQHGIQRLIRCKGLHARFAQA